jgi:dynein heavy chain, axonemal
VCEADELVVEDLLQAVIPDAPGDFIDLSQPEMAASRLLFCNFAETRSADYTLAQSSTSVKSALAEIINVYNQAHSKAQLKDLQLFTYMIEHLSRISRIVRKPKGHGLLVSLGGNGRTTLTKLAAFINDCTLFKIDFTKNYSRTEWLDDMKAMFKQAGVEARTIVFALTTTEAGTCPGAIEDVSSITNSGEVPNLYSQDDVEEIKGELGKQAKKSVGVDLWQLFSQ